MAEIMAGPKPKLPYQQLMILCFCRLAEPITLSSIFPYSYYMIKSFNVPKEDIAFWVGITAASFSFSQMLTAILWGYLSDRIGRKPAMLLGLLGSMLSCLSFGFSTTLPMAIASRSALGLLNGNVGILRTVVAELVPEKSLQPRAFSLLPLTWSIGVVIGPMIGGFLSDPVRQYPDYFSKGGFLDKYPFALPNIVVATALLSGFIAGFLFLKETLITRKDATDPGLILGQRLINLFRWKNATSEHKNKQDSERTSLLESSTTNGIQDEETLTSNSSAKSTSTKSESTLKKIFTLETTLYMLGYFFVACHCVSFDQLMPVFLSTQPAASSQHLPFKIWGGLGLTASQIGVIFSISGVTTTFIELVLFPPITKKLGSLRIMRIVSPLFPLVYAAMPYVLVLPQSWQEIAVICIAFVRWVCGSFAFPCITILLINSASDSRILGTLNGIATTASALGRCAGPAGFGGLFSVGLKTRFGVLPWFVLALVAGLGTIPLAYSQDEHTLTSSLNQPVDTQNERSAEQEGNTCVIDDEGTKDLQRT